MRRLPVSTRPLLQVSAKSGAGVQELFVKAAVRAADAAKDRRAPAATARIAPSTGPMQGVQPKAKARPMI